MNQLDRRDFMVRSSAAAAAALSLPTDWPLNGERLAGAESVQIGLVGAGRHGRAILAELAKFPSAKIVALADVDPNRLRSAKRRAKNAQGYTSHSELLDQHPEVQAVIVATPTHAHKDVAIDALQAGKHVFCEAPLASTVEDCRALAQAARGAKTSFAVGLQGRTNPVYKLARSFARSGSLETVASLRAQWNKKTSWRAASSDPAREAALNWRLDKDLSLGLPGEIASHQIDTINWFLNKYPIAVRGTGAVHLHEDGREIPDTVHLSLEYPDGVWLDYQASLCSSFESSYELLRGTNATIKLAETFGWMFKEADSATQGWEVYASRESFHNDEGITLIANATSLAAQGKLKEGIGLPHLPLYYALENFLLAAAEGKRIMAGVEVGLRAAVIGIKAHEAVMRRTRIELTEDLYRTE